MQLLLTEDQALLARTAREYVSERGQVAALRRLRDSKDERAYSLDTYQGLAELGFTGILHAESDGGLGLGLAELVLVTEAMGRYLAPEPLIPSSVLAGRCLALLGTSEQRALWLAPLIAGNKVLALAYASPQSRFELSKVPVQAERTGAGYRLTGEYSQVWGGHLADAYVVAARTQGQGGDARGISLFLVPAAAPGVFSWCQRRVDSQNAAILKLEGVEVSDRQVLGRVDQGYEVLERVIDEATVALCGEMLGGMREAFERTVAYLRERKQFGMAIGSFQALKHRAARLYVELELAHSAVMAAARASEPDGAGGVEARKLVSLAKARLSDAFCLVTNEAVQLHGGIGMTDEHEIGFFMKRARACEMTFGDAAFHRRRFASLSGY